MKKITPKKSKGGKCYGPCSEKQKLILQDTTTDIILLGGGAGGGKSRICLTKNLDGVNDPHFRCTIFRRTYPELSRQGGLIDESKAVYTDFRGEYKSQAKIWKFPSGASIAFSAIATDEDLGSWQGSQLTRILIDEAGDKWTEKQVLFLLSRLRAAHSKVYPQLILTCNPDVDSFLKSWVDYCLDEDTGIPVEGTENKIRWLVNLGGEVLWADSPEESFELHGKPRGMIYALGMSLDEMEKYPKSSLFIPKSFRFIPTGVFDNPYLLPPRNTNYLPNLLSLKPVDQAKFLHGSWTAREMGSSYFSREWVEIVPFAPENPVSRVRAWDFAASEKTRDTNPDFTCGVKMSRDRYGIYYIEDVIRFQHSTDKVLKKVIETAMSDGLEETDVYIPVDVGAAGKTAANYYQKVLAENGVCVKKTPSMNSKSKLTRFKPLCSLAESGHLRVVKGAWNSMFFNELENFTGERSNGVNKDDQVDASADAFNALAKQITIPTFALPAFTQPSPIPKLM